jgi:hypothetical protein
LSDEWFGQGAALEKSQEVAKQPSFDPHFKTERSPQFQVALQMIFEVSAGHA